MHQGFLNLTAKSAQEASILVLPLPYQGGISYLSGAGDGPEAILGASEQLELFDLETKFDMSDAQIHTFPVPKHFENYEQLRAHVQSVFSQIEPARQFYLGIGGDHCVTIPAVEALRAKIGDFGIVQIDAHADLRDQYQNNPYSHASIMRRVSEMIGPENILSIGVRAICAEEYDFIREHKIMMIEGNQSLDADLLPDLTEKLARLPEKVFITVDLDGLDPTILPHVGTPVPGGLSWKQTLSIIRRVFERKQVVGADVVEIASSVDTAPSDFAAALLIQKIMLNYLKS